jgi:hypothetical protein
MPSNENSNTENNNVIDELKCRLFQIFNDPSLNKNVLRFCPEPIRITIDEQQLQQLNNLKYHQTMKIGHTQTLNLIQQEKQFEFVYIWNFVHFFSK